MATIQIWDVLNQWSLGLKTNFRFFIAFGLSYQYYKEFQIWKGLQGWPRSMVLKFLGPLRYKKINEDPGQELDPTCHNLRVCMLQLKFPNAAAKKN